MPKKIIAAGGLVMNNDNYLLMIFRRGKWDLPKGKLDKGEKIEECAVREVKEETGLQEIILSDFIGITLHEYDDAYLNKTVIKETHWYKMFAKGKQNLIPQTEEHIEEIIWADEKAIKEKLGNSYPNIIEIVNKLNAL